MEADAKEDTKHQEHERCGSKLLPLVPKGPIKAVKAELEDPEPAFYRSSDGDVARGSCTVGGASSSSSSGSDGVEAVATWDPYMV